MKSKILQGCILLTGLAVLPGCDIPLVPKEPINCEDTMECAVEPIPCEAYVLREIEELRCCALEGDPRAAASLGRIYFRGEGVPKDLEKAAYWYRKAAECLPHAMVQMGNFYRDGTSCIGQDIEEAICWYERAAQCGDITAMLALGKLYKGHCGLKANFSKSLCWYERAMNLGSLEAEYEMGWLLIRGVKPGGLDSGIDRIVSAAKMGHPDALATLGDLFLEGKAVYLPDLCCALQYYEKAALAGSAEGAFKLGMLYATGQGVIQDSAHARKWITMAAERGLPAAQVYLGNLYRDCNAGRCYKKSAHWYWLAAQTNCVPHANAALADLYLAGKGVPRILEEAARLYVRAVEQTQDPYAALMLSAMYAEGYGVAFDLAKSVAYYKIAEKRPGFFMAQYRVGKRYAEGLGFKKNLKEAHRWYLLAAEGCLPLAQVELGDMYYEGIFVEQDFATAYEWYKKAAIRGHSYASFKVGIMWLNGQGVPENAIQGATWIRKAAFNGYREAQYELGLLYIQGLGVPQSYPRAYAWIHNALREVEDATPTTVKYVVEKMKPSMRERAVLLAEKYKRKYRMHAQVNPRY